MAELSVVVFDGYDREVFERVLARHRELRNVCERLSRVLPHAQHLVMDVFCLLFKLTTVLRSAKELSAAVLIHHGILGGILESPALAALRTRTELDESNAAVATGFLAERILEGLKTTFKETPRELLDTRETAHDEEMLTRKRSELSHLEEIGEFDESSKETLREELIDEIDELEARLVRHRKRQTKAAKATSQIDELVSVELENLPAKLDEVDEFSRSFAPGDDGGVSAEERFELGERVMRSRGLKRLARLLGAFREVAHEARRRRVVRAPQETHSIALGSALERLLPSELLSLRGRVDGSVNRGLRVDFLRKFAENQLQQYLLEAASSRGPMVVCLDGSGSMQGTKELWGKAVALTLMDIARRERRRCLGIIFSSDEPLFEVDLLDKRVVGARARVNTDEVLRFAEYFPAGGTDFGPPLERALEAVSAGDYRRGDVVFITDGHAPVSDELVARVERERRRSHFKIRAILVDTGAHEAQSVERFADDIRQVSDLASDSLSDLFEVV